MILKVFSTLLTLLYIIIIIIVIITVYCNFVHAWKFSNFLNIF